MSINLVRRTAVAMGGLRGGTSEQVCPGLSMLLARKDNRPVDFTPYLIRPGRSSSMLSFSSGHDAYTMFPPIFIAVYLHYRMPDIVMGSVLQTFVPTAAVTAASYIRMTRVSDYKHHWTDVLGGMIIGALLGIFAASFLSLKASDLSFIGNRFALQPGIGIYRINFIECSRRQARSHRTSSVAFQVRYASDVHEFDVAEGDEVRERIASSS
ncbi:Phospholipid phosphatase 1 [Taenia crassiceps]|uniref:Phospholipid phosphatase 1 n=1 Tax=Taenia crassiceps TaxID=6207 RepID=A0ABR4Q8P3_9CEST